MQRRLAALAALVCAGGIAAPTTVGAESNGLMDLSLEELADFQVTTVSKTVESLGQSAAAVHVITREDMRRSGYTSVAEALRMVPGMQVAREKSYDWAIGSRGFNTGLSNKLLVLVDGRSVYSPFYSGVFWELRDVPVEDIERIEVIRGPGASLWGANAVNGVINIITRPAAEASGWTAKLGGGKEESAFGLLRYGSSLGSDADYRITASGFRRDDGRRRTAAADSWWLSRVQGRMDWAPRNTDRVTLTGEIFSGQIDQTRNTTTVASPSSPNRAEGANRLGTSVLARWERQRDDGSGVGLQLWYEYTDTEFSVLRELRHTVDLDVQHHFRVGDRHEVLWGGAYRFSHDDARQRGFTTLDPKRRGVNLFTGFVQDRITVFPGRLKLTLGSKLEHNAFTAFELQPSARVTFTPNETNTLWAAVSRAVRTPTRLENDANLGLAVVPAGFPPPFGDPARPTLIVLAGNGAFDSEKMIAYEAGYRVRPHPSLSLDVATFFNDYDKLLSAELGSSVVVPAAGGVPEHRLSPFVLGNDLDGYSYGTEIAAWWQVRPWWRLHGSWSLLQLHLDTRRGSGDTSSEGQEKRSPEQQLFLRSSLDLPHDVELDAMLRYVGRLSNLDVDDYFQLDLRVGWQFSENWEIAVVGQNLLHPDHAEASGTSATRVQRGVYGQLVWRFGGPR